MKFNDHLYINNGSQLKGACIESLDNDPETLYLNQIWYNTTVKKYKINTVDGIRIVKLVGDEEFEPIIVGDGVNNSFLIDYKIEGDVYLIIRDLINNDYTVDIIGKNYIVNTESILVSFTGIPAVNQYKIYVRQL